MRRREWIGLAGAAALAPAQTRYDLLIRNGTVFDPARKLNRRADIGIRGETIAAIEDRIDPGAAGEVVDAAGLYVTPGLVDLHTHCYHSATLIGIEADPVAARTGVTTWVDAGTFGYAQTPGFRRFIVQPSRVRIYGFVYLYMDSRNPDQDWVKYVRGQMRPTARAVQDNPDLLLGVKLQVGSNMSGRYSPDFFKIARELCDQYKLKLMAHVSFAPPEPDEVMTQMRPGDIVTHCFNTHSIGILDANGRVRQSVRDARARGVLFDVGHGNGSFNFNVARKALDQDFPPDTISTDIYTLNVKGPVFDMPTTLMKMLTLGMSLEDVIAKSTAAPAAIINRLPGMGTIQVGGPADLAVLRVDSGSFPLIDSQKNTVNAEKRITAQATICRGKTLKTP